MKSKDTNSTRTLEAQKSMPNLQITQSSQNNAQKLPVVINEESTDGDKLNTSEIQKELDIERLNLHDQSKTDDEEPQAKVE